MPNHKARAIRFREVVSIDGWRVKVYVISKAVRFDHPDFYRQALDQLPHWLQLKNGFNDSHDGIAFLILHSGSDGIFSIINWWVDREMRSMHIFHTAPGSLGEFKKVSGQGLAPCIWELGVIAHESTAWTHHVLKPSTPSKEAYLLDVFNGDI